MSVKVTIPNTSSDSVVFGSANTPTAAEVVGIDSGSSNGQLAFKTTASGTSTERMRITSAGKVGIGTSSPLASLDLGASYITATNTAADVKLSVTTISSTEKYGFFVDDSATLVSLSGQDSSAGKFKWVSATTEKMSIDSSGVLSFNSGYGSSAKAYGCRAWVNFNGTGTVAIRASGNVSSITDNGTGDYTLNFTSAMPDANYEFSGSVGFAATAIGIKNHDTVARTSSALRIYTFGLSAGNLALGDYQYVNVSVHR